MRLFTTKMLKIYTDGSCLGNPGPGGAAAVLIFNNKMKLCVTGGARYSNNQVEELRAAVLGLETVESLELVTDIKIYTDSNYVLKGITEWAPKWRADNWRRKDGKPVKHREMWERFYELHKLFSPEMVKVKAHSGDVYNDLADRLAKMEAKKRKDKFVKDYP